MQRCHSRILILENAQKKMADTAKLETKHSETDISFCKNILCQQWTKHLLSQAEDRQGDDDASKILDMHLYIQPYYQKTCICILACIHLPD